MAAKRRASACAAYVLLLLALFLLLLVFFTLPARRLLSRTLFHFLTLSSCSPVERPEKKKRKNVLTYLVVLATRRSHSLLFHHQNFAAISLRFSHSLYAFPSALLLTFWCWLVCRLAIAPGVVGYVTFFPFLCAFLSHFIFKSSSQASFAFRDWMCHFSFAILARVHLPPPVLVDCPARQCVYLTAHASLYSFLYVCVCVGGWRCWPR